MATFPQPQMTQPFPGNLTDMSGLPQLGGVPQQFAPPQQFAAPQQQFAPPADFQMPQAPVELTPAIPAEQFAYAQSAPAVQPQQFQQVAPVYQPEQAPAQQFAMPPQPLAPAAPAAPQYVAPTAPDVAPAVPSANEKVNAKTLAKEIKEGKHDSHLETLYNSDDRASVRDAIQKRAAVMNGAPEQTEVELTPVGNVVLIGVPENKLQAVLAALAG